ncbi:FAD-dependent monooxygenase [Nonomuraea glycinis]|uniref:FAD-dependent monooxygenase n=1 Tax=Nonomuraea glycinis TaxID=2047744 RepID=UPI0033A59D58
MTNDVSPVMVVGAGPVGLTMALALTGQGVPCRVVDRSPERNTGTGCHVLWPRTLETLEAAGLPVAGLVEKGLVLERKTFHLGQESFSHGLTDPYSLWPLPLSVPQSILEQTLTEALAARGVAVERRTEVTGVSSRVPGVRVAVRRQGRQEELVAGYAVYATGGARGPARSVSRRWSTPLPPVAVAHVDVRLPEGTGFDDATEHIFLGAGISVGLVPLPGGRHRLFVVTAGLSPAAGPPAWRDVSARVRDLAGVLDGVDDLGEGWWFTARQSVAERFGSGRRFLLGEAAWAAPMPVHGLNGGIQDAGNLAWKLGEVVRGETEPWLLDTYDTERRAVARSAADSARRILAHGTAADPGAAHRERIRGRRHDVKTEQPVRYAAGALHRDTAGGAGVAAGEHVPECPVTTATGTSTTLLRTMMAGHEWTMLIMTGGRPAGALTAGIAALRSIAAAGHGVRVRVVHGHEGAAPEPDDLIDADGTAHRTLAATEPRVYLIRPDGFVGYRGSAIDLDGCRAYTLAVIRSRSSVPAAVGESS